VKLKGITHLNFALFGIKVVAVDVAVKISVLEAVALQAGMLEALR
jgi:hypothetical protein